MPSLEKELLKVEGLTVDFDHGKPTEHRALDGVSLSIAEGEILGLVGESGSGKTVLSHSILGLLPGNGRITSGSIRWRGQELQHLSEKQLRPIRGKEIAMIFQDPQASLNPVYPVGQQIEWILGRHRDIRGAEARGEIMRLFESVKLRDPERCIEAYPHELSGGMCQRVMIAMALAGNPALLLADEPTSALDVTIQAEIADLLVQIQRDMKLSMLFVTHDLGLASYLCDTIFVMNQGEIVEHGSTESVFQNPSHEYTKRLIHSLMIPGQVDGRSKSHLAAT